ncbi:MAG: transcription termination factor NusA [Patescibacteria group bacterium]|nr:transcription termination factor NusA [Patescibacteria group bacterium]
MTNQIVSAIKQICEEKGISEDLVLEAIEQALAAAYRKDFGEKGQNVEVKFDPETGKMQMFDVKSVVDVVEREVENEEGEMEMRLYVPLSPEEISETEDGEEITERRFNSKKDLTLDEAKAIKKTAKLGDEIRQKLDVPSEFGRVAAQVAKQVITQRLNEIEKDVIYEEFKNREGQIVVGLVQRIEPTHIVVDFERTSGIIPKQEQIYSFRYRIGQKIKLYVLAVDKANRGPKILLSHIHPAIVKDLFNSEIPEINNGSVEIKSIAREAGSRTKIAVESKQENVDPIGSCVGQRGARIQVIISELGGEKIDIINYNEKPETYISNALAPAKVSKIEINEETKIAKVMVKNDQLSLAIGKSGQNVRLAAHLTGWKLAIVSEHGEEVGLDNIETKEPVDEKLETVESAPNQNEDEIEKIIEAEPVVDEE